jgi:hypothetical protein
LVWPLESGRVGANAFVVASASCAVANGAKARSKIVVITVEMGLIARGHRMA